LSAEDNGSKTNSGKADAQDGQNAASCCVSRVVALCSCDSTDAHMGRFDFVLLHLTGQESLSGKSGSK